MKVWSLENSLGHQVKLEVMTRRKITRRYRTAVFMK